MSGSDLSVARPALRVLVGQLAVTAALSGTIFFIWGRTAAFSALAGGGIGIVATAVMAAAAYRTAASASAGGATARFFVGWFVKVLLTITLLVIAFKSKSVAPLPLIAGYAATYLAYLWVGSDRRP